MPWKTTDVDRHKKGLSDKAKRKWVNVANSARERCIDKGGSEKECDGSAIRQANAVVSKSKEAETMPDDEGLEEATKTVDGKKYPSGDFLVVEDATKPTTWHLQVKRNGKPDHGLMGGAKAALTSPGGHRGNRYEGPNKTKAVSKLKALYKSEEMEWTAAKEAASLIAAELMQTAERLLKEVSGSLGDQEHRTRNAFRSAFGRRGVDGYLNSPYVRDVFVGDPEMGDAIVVDDAGVLYQVDYSEGEDGFTFDDRPSWVKVELFYRKRTAVEAEAESTNENEETEVNEDEAAEVELAESAAGSILELIEESVGAETHPARQPLTLDIAVIRPGFGNAKDKRYYSAEMLKRDAHVFEGAKMYTTDHRPEEKSVRTEVAKIRKIIGFTDNGAPIARAVVFDPGFAEATRNRAKAGELGSLECSILASGRVKPGKVDGKKANVVEAITKAISVDFVTKAGAGGQALSIAESTGGIGASNVNETEQQEQEQQAQEQESEQEPQEEQEVKQPAAVLAEIEVSRILSESKLPKRSQERLTETEYADEAAVKEAVQKEIEYIKELSGSGQVIAQGATGPVAETRISEADLQKRFDAIDRRHGQHVKEV